MISDPIIGMDIPSSFQTSESGNGRFWTIRLTDTDSDSIWSIGRWDRGAAGVKKRYYNNGGISAEQFIEMLITYYPEYLEWFLFHPEWL